jgi:hypothetical protein
VSAPRLIPCAICGHLYVCHLFGTTYVVEMEAEGKPTCPEKFMGTIPKPHGHLYVEGTA